MAYNHFKATVWSANLQKEIDETVKEATEFTNTSFEGKFKNVGDEVVICGAGDVEIYSSDEGEAIKLGDVDIATSVSVKLRADKQHYFNFSVPDLDKAQGTNGQVATYTKIGAEKVSTNIAKDIYKAYASPTVKTIEKTVNIDNILATLDEAVVALKENNIFPMDTPVRLTVSPAIMTLIENADAKLNTNNSQIIERGGVKSYKSVELRETNHLFVDKGFTYAPMRTKRALAHQNVVNTVEAYRPQNSFADAVKSLVVTGQKVVFPKEVVVLKLKTA